MKNIIILISIGLLLIGCGGGGSSFDSNGTIENHSNEAPKPNSINNLLIKDTDMIINTTYTVSQGDQIIKSSDNTLLRITHIDGQKDSDVVLVEGSATIIVKK